jgi:IS605 OrfB family transposase
MKSQNKTMTRRSQVSITESNTGKLSVLDSVFAESRKVINLYINELWDRKDFSSKFVKFKVDTWLTARLQQCLGKQALEIVKSQRRKKKQSKPVFKKYTINLDARFIDIQYDKNTYDIWFKLNSVGHRISLNLPGKKHEHFHKYDTWDTQKSYRLRKLGKKYFIDMVFTKKAPPIKTKGRAIGIDIGYKKLIATSDDKKFDTGLEKIYNKIAHKKQGSKAFKRALKERDNKIGESVNLLPFKELRTIVAEDLKNVKKNTRKKIYKKFNNKLQRWSYTKVLDKLSLRCAEQGVLFKKVSPAYTSQTCCSCGFRHKNNRAGERFKCLKCGMEMDADYNASKNILHLGVQ